MRRWVLALAVLAATVSGAGRPAEADVTERERGRLIAEGRCGRCHGTGVDDRSPHPLVLPLRDFALRYPIDMIVDALATGTVEGHDEMPMFVLDPSEVRALVAYIDSLSPPTARYLTPPR